MKRHPALIPLSHDHHNGLMLAQLIKIDAPEYKGLPSSIQGKKDFTLSTFEEELLPHFNQEEKILFPLISKKDEEIDDLVKELLNDHNKIIELVKKLSLNKNLETVLNEIGVLLSQHIRKEERKLFQKIQSILNEDELKAISEKLNNERDENYKFCLTKKFNSKNKK